MTSIATGSERGGASLRRRWPLAIALMSAAVVVAWLVQRSALGRTDAGKNAHRPSIPVVVGRARSQDVPRYLDGLGTATAFATVTVRSRVDGELLRVAFREGQTVHAGDVLAEIDPRAFKVQLDQAEGTLARDAAQLDNAKLDLARFRRLKDESLIPDQQLDAQVALVAQLTGSLRVDQAAIDNARLQLSYCRITAPVTGRAGLKLVDAGNLVHASDPAGLVVLTQVQPMTVVFSLPEDDVREVVATAAGAAPLVVTALDRGGKLTLATGRLLTPDNQIDPTTGTFRLKAVFDNAHDELFPNQFVNVRLLLATHKDRVVVPATAVQRGQQGAFVFGVLPDDTVKLQTVTVGATVGDDVEITNGLRANDTVVVDGADRLVDGARVEPQQAAPGAASPPRKPKA